MRWRIPGGKPPQMWEGVRERCKPCLGVCFNMNMNWTVNHLGHLCSLIHLDLQLQNLLVNKLKRPSAIPGPVSDEIILPVTESIGVKLLLKMGWRHGHSIKDSNANSQYDARREACKAFLAFSSDDSKAQNLSLSRATLKVLQNGLLMMMFCHTKAHLRMARLRGLRILGPITSPLPLLQMVGRRTQAHTHPMTLTSSPTFAA
ncbi:uncharacterized protein LOC122296431 isoform X6 [Carya illinoinensis]|uniref:uncharacterized protein LOC122296431 isoform X6 n=1 Tax=Carya illinoinensis TaxID=32201 RepID=UPI001C728DBD|nr:uncharacterized protein LOC122296431 isoform X6 [Carya illinoinensis]